MSFALFRLPEVALEELVKNYSHKEVLFLVQTSQKARRRISRHTIKTHSIKPVVFYNKWYSSVELRYDNREIFEIHIQSIGDHFNSTWRFQTIVPVLSDGNSLSSYWIDHIEAFKEILNFINEIFRIEKVLLEIKVKNSREPFLIAEHVILMNLNIGYINWQRYCGKEEMEKLLIVSKDATDLIIKGFDLFSTRFDRFDLLQKDRLEIDHSTWMTVENILALRNCKRVWLRKASFKPLQVNQILQECLENPGELQLLRMYSLFRVTLENIVTGLNAVRVQAGIIKRVRITGNNGIQFLVTLESKDTIVIKRET
uniref:F-box domain-containing protein n=1 Tax=Caenorhabditis tropicalis TaxID=1561998 RepID=A0A1I7UT83_9PELO